MAIPSSRYLWAKKGKKKNKNKNEGWNTSESLLFVAIVKTNKQIYIVFSYYYLGAELRVHLMRLKNERMSLKIFMC